MSTEQNVTKRPGTVTAAYIIFLISVIFGAIGGLGVVVVGLVRTPLIEGFVAVIGGIIMLALAALLWFFARKMRDGVNWARIVLTVLGVLQVFGGTGTSGQTDNNALVSVTIGGPIITIIAIVLMWLPKSNQHFKAHS